MRRATATLLGLAALLILIGVATACSEHLAWGYVDHPPLSIALLALIRAILGDALWAPIYDLLIVGGAVLSVVCVYGAMRIARRKRLLENLPTSKMLGAFIGLVELKGTAESEAPLVSYLASRRCVYFSWSVEEHWSRMVTETHTDDKGRTRTRTRYKSGWKTVADGKDRAPFYLQDDTGVIRILPDRAKVEPLEVFSETCRRKDPLYFAKGPRKAVSHSDHRRRFREEAIPLHAPLYVVGKARERDDVVAAEVAHDPDAPMFLISTGTEKVVTTKLGWFVVLWAVLGLIPWVAGVVARDGAAGIDLTNRWPNYVFVGLAYGFPLILGWIWMVHNSFVNLLQRVDQAWSLIDIQLKRRNNIVPRVVEIVKGLRDYERTVQTELAELRSQLDPTPPGRAGPDPRGCVRISRVIVERYPELKTNEAFLRLQETLVETEQRIALARGYFNDIATFYNVRLEVIPDRWISKLSRLKPRALWEAEDFERAPVAVSLATWPDGPTVKKSMDRKPYR